jgi:hypothetical protein
MRPLDSRAITCSSTSCCTRWRDRSRCLASSVAITVLPGDCWRCFGRAAGSTDDGRCICGSSRAGFAIAATAYNTKKPSQGKPGIFGSEYLEWMPSRGPPSSCVHCRTLAPCAPRVPAYQRGAAPSLSAVGRASRRHDPWPAPCASTPTQVHPPSWPSIRHRAATPNARWSGRSAGECH